MKHADTYYKPSYGENREAGCISDALAVLQKYQDENGEKVEYGPTVAEDFRPKDLKRVRDAIPAQRNIIQCLIRQRVA